MIRPTGAPCIEAINTRDISVALLKHEKTCPEKIKTLAHAVVIF